MLGIFVLAFMLLSFNGNSTPAEEGVTYMDAYWRPNS